MEVSIGGELKQNNKNMFEDNKFKSYIYSLMCVEEQCKGEYIIDINMFEQTWDSTCLGFGGIGGQSITSAITVVVRTENNVQVFFGGRLAYLIRPNKEHKYKEEVYTDLLLGKYAEPLRNCGKYMWPKEEELDCLLIHNDK